MVTVWPIPTVRVSPRITVDPLTDTDVTAFALLPEFTVNAVVAAVVAASGLL